MLTVIFNNAIQKPLYRKFDQNCHPVPSSQCRPSCRCSHVFTIGRPCRSLANMATITPPRSQHNLKASTLPQAAKPPTRKPRGLKAFWRRLSQSPRPDEKEKRSSKGEKIRSTVSAQSLEAVLSPSGRRASGNTPEKRKSSFGTFFSSAFSHGKQEKDERHHKKHSRSRAAAPSDEKDVNAATTPGSHGNGKLGTFDYNVSSFKLVDEGIYF